MALLKANSKYSEKKFSKLKCIFCSNKKMYFNDNCEISIFI